MPKVSGSVQTDENYDVNQLSTMFCCVKYKVLRTLYENSSEINVTKTK